MVYSQTTEITIIMNKLELLEFSSRIGSILVWIGLWNIIVIMVDETNILKNILVFIFGMILWLITDSLVENRSNTIQELIT